MTASLAVFEKEHAAQEKYIYFICSVASALLAYLGKDYKVSLPWTTHDTLTMATLGSLLLSFLFGISRILCYNYSLGENKEMLIKQEEVGNCVEALLNRIQNEQKIQTEGKGQGLALSINKKTGKPVSAEELNKAIEEANAKSAKHFKLMTRWYNISTVCFVICHVFLVAGLGLMLWAKLVT